MIFVTGANYRFKEIVKEWKSKVSLQGYSFLLYDLGNLNEGIKGLEETDNNFQSLGYYNSLFGGKWKSTALWKPKVILDALNRQTDNIAYLDADAFLMHPIIINYDFDIGVVKRVPNQEKDNIKQMLRGDYNAGVLFLKNSKKVKDFVIKWTVEVYKAQNDQLALNNLLKDSNLKVKVFDEKYNYNTNKGFIYHQTGNKKNGKKLRSDNY